jgi:diguanylate cyclase (GGDEF)-like protein/PAS domain S-box-containing protein
MSQNSPAKRPHTLLLPEVIIEETILNNSHDTIYFKDRDSRFLLISQKQSKRFQLSHPAEVAGKTDFDFFAYVHAQEAWEDEQNIMQTGIPIIDKIEREVWPNGEVNYVSTCKYPLRDKKGAVIGTWGMSKDITGLMNARRELEEKNRELETLNRKLEEVARVDDMTGLYNHRHFRDEVNRYFQMSARRRDQGDHTAVFSLLLFDLDKFKDINDTHGHLCGDEVLRQVGRGIKQSIRTSDHAFRYGGDEFIVLFPETAIDNCRHISQKVQETLQGVTAACGGRSIRFTISCGIASSLEAPSFDELLNLVDQRMYQSKRGGGGRISG